MNATGCTGGQGIEWWQAPNLTSLGFISLFSENRNPKRVRGQSLVLPSSVLDASCHIPVIRPRLPSASLRFANSGKTHVKARGGMLLPALRRLSLVACVLAICSGLSGNAAKCGGGRDMGPDEKPRIGIISKNRVRPYSSTAGGGQAGAYGRESFRVTSAVCAQRIAKRSPICSRLTRFEIRNVGRIQTFFFCRHFDRTAVIAALVQRYR